MHDQHLTSNEILTIRNLRLNFRYNFAQPPKPEIDWLLVDLIAHARFPTARLDACDKWNIQFLTIENFSRIVDQTRIAEPGYLSATTVAKAVVYCLQIVESTAESFEAFTGRSSLDGDDLLEQIRTLANQSMEEDSVSPWKHFFVAVRHPTIRWAVSNAVINRWGAKDLPPVAPSHPSERPSL